MRGSACADAGRAIDLADNCGQCEFLLRPGMCHYGMQLQLLDQSLLASPFDLLFLVDSIERSNRAKGAALVSESERYLSK